MKQGPKRSLWQRYKVVFAGKDTISTQQSLHTMRWVPSARRVALTTMRPRTSPRHGRALAAVDVPSPTTIAADARRRPQPPSPTLNAVAAAAAVVRCSGGGDSVVARFFEEDDGT